MIPAEADGFSLNSSISEATAASAEKLDKGLENQGLENQELEKKRVKDKRADDPLEPNCSEATELLQWWHRWQMQMLCQEANYIRNDLLQEVFAIRRQLESAFETTTAKPHGKPQANISQRKVDSDLHLAKLTQLYASLEQLSDRLESPYGQEALPLALRHTVEPWQQHLPITFDFPQTWELEPALQVRLLIAVVNVLCLTLASSEQQPQNCFIRLTQCFTQSRPFKEMSATITFCDLPPPVFMETVTAELTPILKTFQLLTQGSYTIQKQAHQWSWILRFPHS
ncbi:MAG: hypothetical protein AB8B99_12715 [Phormidesmis sp.]